MHETCLVVVLLLCCGVVWREKEGDGVIIEAVLVVSLVSKRRKKDIPMIFFIHNLHKFLPFVVVFCRQVFHSFFIIHPCCRLVVNLVSKKHRKKNNLRMAFFIFRSWFTCSCPFVIHHAFCSFIIPVVDHLKSECCYTPIVHRVW